MEDLNKNLNHDTPILSWCKNLEDGALEQIENAADHPAVFKHVALMPDAHQGYGVPIGSVIALNNSISPNMVGVDIGCTDMDTEYLSESGWKKIKDYKINERIMVYEKNSNSCFFDSPEAYIIKGCGEFNHLDSSRVDQMLSDDHNSILFSRRTGKPIDGNILSWINSNKQLRKGVSQQFKNHIPNLIGGGVNLTNNEIRLIVAISADGCIRKSGKIEFHLKKDRKINRLKKLLLNCKIDINEYNLKDKSAFACSFEFNKATKDLSVFWLASRQQLEVVFDEFPLWDGHITEDHQINYYSTVKENIDVIQYVMSVCGIRANYYKQPVRKNYKNWSDSYILYSTNNNSTQFPYPDKIKRVKSIDGKSYCFTTKTGYWIMRRGGKIVITGNCGMAAIRLNVTNIEKSKLIEMKEMVQSLIPVGLGSRRESESHNLDLGRMFHYLSQMSDKFSNNYMYKVEKSLGTLGGGNHFIEFQEEADGHLWVMIHSGSRNFGHSIATHFNEVAKENNNSYFLDTEDLAFLPLSSKDGKNYVRAMTYALEYAKENRRIMMYIVKRAVKLITNGTATFELDVHHNYAALENHYGKNVWVHRKGATSARKNELGIIPGSMGTNSYIVKGLGNHFSFNSCSHGAGRVYSRTKATTDLNVSEQEEMMNDIIFDGFEKVKRGNKKVRGMKDLGEAPGAYKNIDNVMECQKDLVSIDTKLYPKMVIKG